MLVTIVAWVVLGAIAGYIAGFLVRGDEGLGIVGHIVLGIVGARHRRIHREPAWLRHRTGE